MSQTRLFTSSLSRRQLARRRSSRSARAVGRQLMLALLVAALCLAAFVAGHQGL